jgi:DNA-binding MurR/RpiR family transcriptional regulator
VQELRLVRGSLSQSEARVVDTVLEDPYAFLSLSTSEVAARAQTSGATVVRACRALGFDGLRDLRLTLARDLGFPDVPDDRHAEDGASFLESVFAEAGQTIASMVTAETAREFDHAVECMAGAGRILAVANGPTFPLVQDFVNYAVAWGCPGECWNDAMMQIVAAGRLVEGDVCLAVSHTGSNGLTIQAAEAALSAGANVVSVSGYRRSRLVDISTVAIVAQTFDFSTSNRSLLNSAGMLIILRSLASGVSSAKTGRAPSERPSVRDIVGRLRAFEYRSNDPD